MKSAVKIFMIILALSVMAGMTSCSGEEPTLLSFTEFTPHFSDEYAVLEKDPEKDFVVLNLTDPQMNSSEWKDGNINRAILEYTVTELVNKVQPDLITISGDLAWAPDASAYRSLADFIDSFGIPWTPAWGNHDNEDGPEFVDYIEEVYFEYENFLYMEGPEELGKGNFVISIEENGKPITGIFMMDTHYTETYVDENGNEFNGYSKLNDEQQIWYKYRAESMKALGYKDSMIIQHIPIYAYKDAFDAAFNTEYDPGSITWQESHDPQYWNEGYEGSYGVRYEYGGFPPMEDGMIDLIEDIGHTTYMVAGHDHVNNFLINYRGINLVYGLKTGMGCYWDQRLNGGTVIKISSEGITELYHEYVNVDHIVEEYANK